MRISCVFWILSCLLLACSCNRVDSESQIGKSSAIPSRGEVSSSRNSEDSVSLRQKVIALATLQVGVREQTGHNDGVVVESYLASVGLEKGEPWCAAFVHWVYEKNGVSCPRSGYCPDWFPRDHIVYTLDNPSRILPISGDVFGIYFSSLSRIAHVGLIVQWNKDDVLTIEGNSNDNGSREGDGVYKKRRLKHQIYAVSSWIKQ